MICLYTWLCHLSTGSVLFPVEEALSLPWGPKPGGPLNPGGPTSTPPSSTLSRTTLSSLLQNSFPHQLPHRGRSFRWRCIATGKRSSCYYFLRTQAGLTTFRICLHSQSYDWRCHSVSCLCLRKNRLVCFLVSPLGCGCVIVSTVERTHKWGYLTNVGTFSFPNTWHYDIP